MGKIKVAMHLFIVAILLFMSAELLSQKDLVYNMLESNILCIGSMQGEINQLRGTIEVKNTVLLQQQKHIDGQRKVIDRLSEINYDARRQLKNAHKITVSQQANLKTSEQIINEAAKRIMELKKEIENLKKKKVYYYRTR